MGAAQVLVTLMGLAIIAVLVFLAVCRYLGLWHWVVAWLSSTKEEKANLTRTAGHYNANGYMVQSDSDIHLSTRTGSFKHLDPVDRDFRVLNETAVNLGGNGFHMVPQPTIVPEEMIPPQPLRPAPPLPAIPIAPLPSLAPMQAFTSAAVPLPATTNPFVTLPQPLPPPPSHFNRTNPFHQQKSVENGQPPPRPPPPLSFGPSLQSQNSVESGRSSPPSELGSPTDVLPPMLKRAMSCDSVSSDTSVVLGDLEETSTVHVSGHLCVGLEYDSEAADLVVSVLEGKDLVGPDPDAIIDTYIRVYLLPDKTTNMQTRVFKKSNNPLYKEKFLFALEPTEFSKRALVFYVYASDKFSNTLIGEAEIKLCDVNLRQPATTWLTLTDTGQRGGELGEIMFSLSYLPTAERLTVVVVKARNLRFPHLRDTGDPFVKVYLLQNSKKISKKKSSTKKGERSPIFNEAMIFSVPAHALQTIQLRITVAESEGEGRAYSLGHVIVGSQASGKALSHWNQMLSSLRKPIAMWHSLRK